MRRIFVTGANRGIGLELVRQYLRREDSLVFAACRRPESAQALHDLADTHNGRLTLIPLEVTSADAIAAAVETVHKRVDALDIFVNNAAVDPPGQSLDGVDETFRVNTVGPLMLVKAYLDLLKGGQDTRVVNVSSEMGSLEQWHYAGDYAYTASKAALNMVTRCLSDELRPFGIVTIALDPGWVQTDMGGAEAELTPQQSVSGMLRVIDALTVTHNGSFLRWNGTTLPW